MYWKEQDVLICQKRVLVSYTINKMWIIKDGNYISSHLSYLLFSFSFVASPLFDFKDSPSMDSNALIYTTNRSSTEKI